MTQIARQGITAQPLGNNVIFYANGVLLGKAPVDPITGNAALGVDGWLAGEYTITASYIGSAGNLASAVSVTMSVGNVRPEGLPHLIVTAPSPTMTYGGPLPGLSPSFTGVPDGWPTPSVTCTTTATVSSPIASYPVTCTSAPDPNYPSITYVPDSLTVAGAPLLVKANNATMVAGQAVPVLTATVTGLVLGQTVTPVCTSDAPPVPVAGMTYTITCTVDASNYSVAYTPGTLTVSPAVPPMVCVRPADEHDSGNRGSKSVCEGLLDHPSPGSGAKVTPGQTMSIVYQDETAIATSLLLAPSVVLLKNTQLLPVTVTLTSHKSSHYESLLTFTVPSTLGPGTYSILITVHDSDGHLDQWIWDVKVEKAKSKDDKDK